MSAFRNHPTPSTRIEGSGGRLAGSQPVRVAIQAQGPVGQVSRRLGARAPRAWGPPSETIQRPANGLGVSVAGLQEVNPAGSRRQGPVGQVSRGLGARAPRAWGPAQGPGAFSPQKPPKPLKLRFFANLLVGAWRRRGCRLKRLLRRWGPGGKRSRDTPPTPPPKRVFRRIECLQIVDPKPYTLNPKP